MPKFDVGCEAHGVTEIVRQISDRSPFQCAHGCDAQWIPTPFYFQEDRLRLWHNAQGTRYSNALGAPMPETIAERDRVATQKGVEFVTPREFLADNKEAREAVAYHEHVTTGGKREDWAPVDTTGKFKATPPPGFTF